LSGIEHAPLTWLWARLMGLGLKNLAIRRRRLLAALDLGDFDLVYAFLSPAPMPRLWAKAGAECRTDATLVSQQFRMYLKVHANR